MTITYPSAFPAGTQYYKYGPVAGNTNPHWYTLPATITGNTIVFSITDGGLGDDDMLANATIVDQGGPGNPGPAGSATAIPTLSEWMLALLGLALMRTGHAQSTGAPTLDASRRLRVLGRLDAPRTRKATRPLFDIHAPAHHFRRGSAACSNYATASPLPRVGCSNATTVPQPDWLLLGRLLGREHGGNGERKSTNARKAAHDMPLPPFVTKLRPVCGGCVSAPRHDDCVDWLVSETGHKGGADHETAAATSR
jgi:hypothetical protein